MILTVPSRSSSRQALIAALTLALIAPFASAKDPASSAKPLFETDIRPIFKAHCFECHGEGEKLKGDLDVRLRRAIVAGGESGPAIVPGDVENSLLYTQVRDGEMPKGKKKLTAAEVAAIKRWIAGGAATARPEPAELKPGFHLTAEERAFWSFQPIHLPEVPAVQHADRVRTPIDSFLLNALEAKNISFSPDADKVTLIRRATFDLTGLPPAPEEIDAFVKDQSPTAYESVIDRLLASPRYGERWGRHWLDVAGYADSDGYIDTDPVRKYAYKYRDYVIRAFNDDKPFDQFIREQLAGDEMIKPPYKQLAPDQIEKLTATGFLRMAPDGTAGVPAAEQAVARNAVVADTIKIVSSSLLGLTVACAQCHDHRYDPISQEDYYRLRAVFEPAYDWKAWRAPAARLISLYTDADRKEAAQIEAEAAKIDAERLAKQNELVAVIFEKEIAKLPEELREPVRAARNTPAGKRTSVQVKLLKEHPAALAPPAALKLYDPKADAELQKFVAQAAAIRAKKKPEDFVQALTELPGAKLPITYLAGRGDPEQPKQAVAPGELSVLCSSELQSLPAKDASLPTSGRRLAYANHLTDGKHPLVARVLVNRVWMHHFGRGIVGTAGDLGVQGDRPSNPQLLDWLASEFMASGWRLKPMHRRIMLSTVYRQSSQRNPAAAQIDPDNHLCWRAPVRRIEAEAVRDSMLAVSGALNGKMFGPPIPVADDATGQTILAIEMRDGDGRQTPVAVAEAEANRRSIYIQVRRSKPFGVLETFDEPTMAPNCEMRNFSTVAPQSLTLMNSTFVLEQARALATRVAKEAGDDERMQITRAWRLALGREPSSQQVDEAMEFLSKQEDYFRSNPFVPAPAPAPAAPMKATPTTKPVAKFNPRFEALASFCQALLGGNAFLYVD